MNRKNKQQHHPRDKCRWLFEMTNEREWVMPSEEEFCNEVAKQELSYDPWGRLRNPATQQVYAVGSEPTLFLGRGYTGHEHLTAFGLINMNARLYDPAVGRF